MKVQRVAFTEVVVLSGCGGSSGLPGKVAIWSMILQSNRSHHGGHPSSSSVNSMLKTKPTSNIF